MKPSERRGAGSLSRENYERYLDRGPAWEEGRFRAYPENYLETVPASLAAFLRIPDGALGVWILVKLFGTIAELARRTPDVMQLLTFEFRRNFYDVIEYISEHPGPFTGIPELLNEGFRVTSFHAAAFLGMVAFYALFLVIDCISAVLLRTLKIGSLAIRVVHTAFAFISFLAAAADVTGIVLVIARSGNHPAAAAMTEETLPSVITADVIVLAIAALLALIEAFYHLGIARAMKTVRHELKTGDVDLKYRRTMLAPLCFFLSFLSFLGSTALFIMEPVREEIMRPDLLTLCSCVLIIAHTIRYAAEGAASRKLGKCH